MEVEIYPIQPFRLGSTRDLNQAFFDISYWLSVTQLSSPIAYWAMYNGHDKTHFEMDAHSDGSLFFYDC